MNHETEVKLDIAFRLRRAVCAISEKRPSVERARIDSFLRFISAAPIITKAYGADFPVTCRQHPVNAERTTEPGGRAAVLYFHIGNAILGFYDLLKSIDNEELTPEKVEEVRSIAEQRVQLLEAVAKSRLEVFGIEGHNATGFTLKDPTNVPNPQPLQV